MTIYNQYYEILSWDIELLLYCITNSIHLDIILIDNSDMLFLKTFNSLLNKIGYGYIVMHGNRYIYKNSKRYCFLPYIQKDKLKSLYDTYKSKITHSL